MTVTWLAPPNQHLEIHKNVVGNVVATGGEAGSVDLGQTVANGDTYYLVYGGTNFVLNSVVASVVDSRNDPDWCP